jgi:hypothetical protein
MPPKRASGGAAASATGAKKTGKAGAATAAAKGRAAAGKKAAATTKAQKAATTAAAAGQKAKKQPGGMLRLSASGTQPIDFRMIVRDDGESTADAVRFETEKEYSSVYLVIVRLCGGAIRDTLTHRRFGKALLGIDTEFTYHEGWPVAAVILETDEGEGTSPWVETKQFVLEPPAAIDCMHECRTFYGSHALKPLVVQDMAGETYSIAGWCHLDHDGWVKQLQQTYPDLAKRSFRIVSPTKTKLFLRQEPPTGLLFKYM